MRHCKSFISLIILMSSKLNYSYILEKSCQKFIIFKLLTLFCCYRNFSGSKLDHATRLNEFFNTPKNKLMHIEISFELQNLIKLIKHYFYIFIFPSFWGSVKCRRVFFFTKGALQYQNISNFENWHMFKSNSSKRTLNVTVQPPNNVTIS